VSTDPVKLRTVRVQNSETAARLLRQLADEADRGEVLSFMGIVETAGGGYETVGSATLSRLQTAGALLECAMLRLKAED
jgi:hypothetical protein